MHDKLHYETVTPQLKNVLNQIMSNSIFNPFYLVGGTSLSLRLGHRKSVDIDLFHSPSFPNCLFRLFREGGHGLAFPTHKELARLIDPIVRNN